MVSNTPRPHFTPGKDPVLILQEAGWAPGPVWTGGKSRHHGDSIPDRPARSQLLYRLSYPSHTHTHTHIYVCVYKLINTSKYDLLYQFSQKSHPAITFLWISSLCNFIRVGRKMYLILEKIHLRKKNQWFSLKGFSRKYASQYGCVEIVCTEISHKLVKKYLKYR